MRILFRVYRQYFDLIASGEKKVELRQMTRYWVGRGVAASAALLRGEDVTGVFVCGRDRRDVDVISVGFQEQASSILHRELSEQGKKDLGGEDPVVVAFYLGEKVES